MKISKHQVIAYTAIPVYLMLPTVVLYWFAPPAVRDIWEPAYFGWVGGFFGGCLWIVNQHTMNLDTLIEDPEPRHWVQVGGRVTMGVFSGAAVVALMPSFVLTTHQPAQMAIGLIAGYSGTVLGGLAVRLDRWLEGKTKTL